MNTTEIIRLNRDFKSESLKNCGYKYGGGLNLKGNKKSKYTLFSHSFFNRKIMTAYYEHVIENAKKNTIKSERNNVQGVLSDLGFERFISNGKQYVTSSNSINDFSTMRLGGVCNYWIKDGVIIMYGLNEIGKPPTLMSPLPYVGLPSTDNTNRCISIHGAEKVVHAIINNEKLKYK